MSVTAPNVVEVTDADFEQLVIEESKTRPVVVDLWAAWCGPCRTLGPILEKVADERGGAFLLAKLDVDANQVGNALLQAVKSQGIPTVVAFRDGQPVSMFIGAYPGAGGQHVRRPAAAHRGGARRGGGGRRGGLGRSGGRRAGLPGGAREGSDEPRRRDGPRADPRRARRSRGRAGRPSRRSFPIRRPSGSSRPSGSRGGATSTGSARWRRRSGWPRPAVGARRSTACWDR